MSLTAEFRCDVIATRYRPSMKQKQFIPEKPQPDATSQIVPPPNDLKIEVNPVHVVTLRKKYDELCWLREQVQIEESRQRLLRNPALPKSQDE